MTLLGLLLKKMRCFMNMLATTLGIFGFWRITIQLAFYKLESIEDSLSPHVHGSVLLRNTLHRNLSIFQLTFLEVLVKHN